jgi:hypothetical protein
VNIDFDEIKPDMLLIKQQKRIAAFMQAFTLDYLKLTYKSLIGGKAPTVKKTGLIPMLLEALIFATENDFRKWFDTLRPLTQNILNRMMFTDFLPISVLEKEFNETFLVRNTHYSWGRPLQVNENLNLDFLILDHCKGQFYAGLPIFLRKALFSWFEPPPEAYIANCVSNETGPGWDNSQLIADSYPLLCDAVQEMFVDCPDIERDKTAKGLGKKRTAELRASSGFLDFEMNHAYCPDSLDLALRFILCIKNFNPVRPEDAYDNIRDMTTAFFSEESVYKKTWLYHDRNYLESNVCIDHLSKVPGYYISNNEGLPPSRETFHEILLEIAKDGRRFDADKLAEHIRITSKLFAFSDSDFEDRLKIKATSLDLDGIICPRNDDEDFRVNGILRHNLLVRPLFKAYCYIFASLGLLEITQKMPPLTVTILKKKLPFSPYDSLETIRITKFGLWCLGMSSEKPPTPSHEYQAIADKELLLVTVQGNSLERAIYLNRIGIKLGENRWRISPASFIAGCESKKQIEDRIIRFKALIDPAPAPHWLELFDKVVYRAGLFGSFRNNMLVYDMPRNRKIKEELLRDPALRKIALRAEGGILIVPVKNQKKFIALLNEHGIAGF